MTPRIARLLALFALAAVGTTWLGCGGGEEGESMGQSTDVSADKPRQAGKAKSTAKGQLNETDKRGGQMDTESSGKPKASRQSQTQRSPAPGGDVHDQNSARKAGSNGKAGQGNTDDDLADQNRAARENASGGGSSNQGSTVDDRNAQTGS